MKEHGEEVQVLEYDGDDDFKNVTLDLMKKFKKEKIALEDVLFLSPKKHNHSKLKQLLDSEIAVNEMGDSYIPCTGKPLYATIQGFKGLD